MTSPDFILIGSAKCGTSSLWSTLGDHPEIGALQGIEVQFFSLDENYERGWQWYIDHFPERNERVRLIGENSNRYTMRERYPHSAARMARHLPNAKLIFIVRHPLRRMESMWLQHRQQGDPVQPNFSRELMRNHHHISDANYQWQLEPYHQNYPASQILVLFAEDYRSRPAEQLARVFHFLGVDNRLDDLDIGRSYNVSKGKRVDSAALFWLRRLPGYGLIKQLAPGGLRKHTKERFLRKTVHRRPKWCRSVHAQVKDEIAADTEVFLRAHEKPGDFWCLNDVEFES